MSMLIHNLLAECQKVGLLSQQNTSHKTVDIVSVDGRPLQDAWTILIDHPNVGWMCQLPCSAASQ